MKTWILFPQVRRADNAEEVRLVTNTTPYFLADGLSPGTDYSLHVSVVSPVGNSSPVSLHAYTIKAEEKRMGN